MTFVPIANPLPTKLPESDQHALSVNEQLDQIFAANCAIVHLLGQMLASMRGQNAPLPGEEVDQLIAEFVDNRNKWSNILQ